MEFAILGPIEARSAGVPIALGGAIPKRLLAVLLLHANRSVAAERLIDLIWGDDPPSTAANTLQVHVGGLRRAFAVAEPAGAPPRIETTADGYRLRLERGELDVDRFEDGLTTARQLAGVEPDRALELVREALARWRGDVLADVALPPDLAPAATRLDGLRRAATELSLGIAIRTGHAEAAIPELEALATADPTDERWLALLMLALYRANRQVDALAAYRVGRERLVAELGLDPGPELQRLQLAMLRQDVDLEAESLLGGGPVSPEITDPTRPEQLMPAEVNAFVGREADLLELEALVDAGARLLTLAGIGGTGKSRLALRLAHRLREHADTGVRWVDLAPVSSGDDVPEAIAAALGVRQQPGRAILDSIVGSIGDRSLLLVVDNCEPVLWHAAHALERLIRACPGLVVVATSRQPLSLAAERVVPVHGLEEESGIGLFLERGRAASPDRTLSDDDLVEIAAIVRRLDGLPLAIEMAAAWLRVMGPAEISARLADRDRLLGLTGSTTDPRHGSLRTAFDSSFELLAAPERTLLARFSTFAGTASLDTIRSVCGDGSTDVAGGLAILVERSLVVPLPSGSVTRYRLLDTIREYGRLRLHEAGEDVELATRHLAWGLALAERSYRRRISDEPGAIHHLTAELDELRLAFDRASTLDPHARPRLAGLLAWFWTATGRVADGRAITETGLAEATADVDRGRLLRGLGSLATLSKDSAGAVQMIEASMAIWHRRDEPFEECLTYSALGWAHFWPGDNELALDAFRRGAAIAERIGDPELRCALLGGEAQTLVALGRGEEARELARRLLQIAPPGDLRTLHYAHHFLGDLALQADDGPTAAVEYGRALNLAVALDDALEITVELQGLAMAQAVLGRTAEAVRLIDAAEAWSSRLGVTVSVPFWVALQQRLIAPVRAAIAAGGARSSGAAEIPLSPAEAVELARRLPATSIEPPQSGGASAPRRRRTSSSRS